MLETEWREKKYNDHREMSTYAIVELREGHRTLQMVRGYRVFKEEIKMLPTLYYQAYNIKGSQTHALY